MSVPGIGDLLRTLPRMAEPVDLEDGRAEITVAMEPDKPFGPDNHLTISDKYIIPHPGETLRDVNLNLARLYLRDARAHLALARWHDTKQERKRQELAKELPTPEAALDEVIRLRAELEKAKPQGNITRIDFRGGAQ